MCSLAVKSAWGPDADWRGKLLICLAVEGSLWGSDSYSMNLTGDALISNGESEPCGPIFRFRPLCRVGSLPKA
jgi:hypothetical protein